MVSTECLILLKCESCFSLLHIVIIVGHEDCGGVKACLPGLPVFSESEHHDEASENEPYHDEASNIGYLSEWLALLTNHARTGDWTPPLPNPRPPKSLPDTLLDLVQASKVEEAVSILVEENVKLQVANLSRRTDLVQPSEFQLLIHGWVYDVNSGRLRVLEGVTRPAEWPPGPQA